jgi:AcrR family transcriptional regulator
MAERATKRRRDGERTREAILDAAREVFVRHGYEGASIRRIAELAGCTHGTLYLHFRDKDDLLYQLSEEHFHQLLARLRALPRALEPVARVREAFGTLVEYGLEFPDHYHLMVALRPPHARQAGAAGFGPMAAEAYGFLYDVVARAAQRERVSSPDPRVDTLALFAAAHGIVELRRAQVCDHAEARAAADRLIAVLLDGLAHRRADSPPP